MDNRVCIFAIRHKTPVRRHYKELNSLCRNSEYSLYQQKVLCPQCWILRKSHTTSTIGRGNFFTNPTSYPQVHSALWATVRRGCATVRRPWCIFTNRHRFKPCFEPLFVKMHHLGPLKPQRSDHPPPNPAAATPPNASGDGRAGIATTKLPTQVIPSQTTRTGSNANAVVVNLKSFSRTL